jgi:hypothetical protein
MLAACRLASLSALEADYASLVALPQFGRVLSAEAVLDSIRGLPARLGRQSDRWGYRHSLRRGQVLGRSDDNRSSNSDGCNCDGGDGGNSDDTRPVGRRP